MFSNGEYVMKIDYEKPNLWILMFEENAIYTETLYGSLVEDNTKGDLDTGNLNDFLNSSTP